MSLSSARIETRTFFPERNDNHCDRSDSFRRGDQGERRERPCLAPRLRTLFDTLDTVDFEVVIKALEDAAVVERVYNKVKRADLFLDDAGKVRRALVQCVLAV